MYTCPSDTDMETVNGNLYTKRTIPVDFCTPKTKRGEVDPDTKLTLIEEEK